MNPVGKALWYIETHFAGELTLEEIANASGVSRFHLARAFEAATERSVMRYVRGRRLSEAAKVLAAGGGDILSIALDWGYGSHEAFTRAFRDQFGLTPDAVRAQRRIDMLPLVEPIKMDDTPFATLDPPRIETSRPLLIAGLGARYDSETVAGIPAQWQRFVPYIGHIPGQVGAVAYGVRHNFDGAGHMDYICGVEVAEGAEPPPELTRVRLPPQLYAVFRHRDHVSQIHCTWHTIWNRWLPDSGHEIARAPDFERYDQSFDPRTGNGGFEIWLPLER